jgi:hypothetical protein
MANWSGDEDISLIVIKEALYYLSAKQQRRFLHACCRSLAPDGHVLVIVHSADKHERTLAVCRDVCNVTERRPRSQRMFLLLESRRKDCGRLRSRTHAGFAERERLRGPACVS